MTNIILLAGLGFGDEGKGTMVDYLARIQLESVHTVVRYNGGAQAAHNVITNAGHHHTFSQFGSGLFAGAKTHLSRHMLVNPGTLSSEARAIEGLGFTPYEWLTVDREARVTTIFHVAANRIREALRGHNRHGSCGLGIGETVSDSIQYPDMTVRIGDLLDEPTLRRKLNFLRDLKLQEFETAEDPVDGVFEPFLVKTEKQTFEPHRLDHYVEWYLGLGKKLQIVDRDHLTQQILKKRGGVIFEGAQGVLLDQDFGFHPYTTWSDTTFGNAYDLLQDVQEPVRKIGVLRGYMTRHGAGPFPTEIDEDNPLEADIQTDQHNKWGQFQQHFRVGHFDLVLARYALEVIGGVDELVITNLDKLGRQPRICTGYRYPDTTMATPAFKHITPRKLDPELTNLLSRVKPVYETLPERVSIVRRIAEELLTPVTWCSSGPQPQHKWPTSLHLKMPELHRTSYV